MAQVTNTACVFAHFDISNIIDEYVLYYLDALTQQCSEIIFVTTSSLDEKSRQALHTRNIAFIERTNEGYDFYSYKKGLEALKLNKFDELILCNDSVYGPSSALQPIIEEMRDRPCDFWGMTESYDLARHLQSYFLVFNQKAFLSETFQSFWNNLAIIDNKREIIESYEVGLSRSLVKDGLTFQAVASFEHENQTKRILRSWKFYFGAMRRRWNDKRFWQLVYSFLFTGMKISVNPTHTEWRSILEHHGVPFIKTELLRVNPTGVKNLHEIYSVLEKETDYPVTLIKAHLSRVTNI
ncbi:hypothetical protein EYC87_19070 [Halieaceae bacterium IMCC8485]|jgi:rhamnosyltransferase|uniref:Rhamnan synthesis protein F n=1 Tax=Candidatus Seongchinamella marina TaxID=2518990 RepID=A0ABT3T0A9_9GAMM|nr:rhamnan synthesis F family protein [Candidatus Seongchinamella marina]MCX2975682.1 hypothetical protein [Candidatus Seongchinamella marina]